MSLVGANVPRTSALGGQRIRDLPIHPDRILAARRAAKEPGR
jgi:hypothetical protein